MKFITKKLVSANSFGYQDFNALVIEYSYAPRKRQMVYRINTECRAQ